MLWILPTPAAPWICRHDGVIDDLPMGAHKYATRPTFPFARRFGFGESQHSQLWSRRLDFNQRSPAYRAGALNAWLRRYNHFTLLQAQEECKEKTMTMIALGGFGETGASMVDHIISSNAKWILVRHEFLHCM